MDERKLPNANLASIPESKIVDYLLSDKHRVGKSKAAFFKSFGFSHERWHELKDALYQHVLKNSLAAMEQTLYDGLVKSRNFPFFVIPVKLVLAKAGNGNPVFTMFYINHGFPPTRE